MHNSKKHIFIIGPSGVGKTTVGEVIAKKLGMNFIDLDVAIESQAGCSITEYFQVNGEEKFRKIESEVLLSNANSAEPTVIVTGAGSILDVLNIITMKQNGVLIFLNAQVKDIISRVKNDETNLRPLLATDIEQSVKAQYEKRIDAYNLAQDITIGTSNRDIETVAESTIRQFERYNGTKIDIGSKIVVGEGLLGQVSEFVKSYSSAILITQENIPFQDVFDVALGINNINFQKIIVPDGEEAKSFEVYQSVLNEISNEGHNRSSCVIALGGGVVGDLAGFVGATFMRGIDVIQVPTTLLSQVDSSIGGKCGINLSTGKNMVGTITQPKIIFSDISFLQTLPDNDYISGLGEVVKYALLGNITVRENIEEYSELILERNIDVLTNIIKSCMNHKIHIVSRDPYERNGMRATLNLGHTLAHVIEKVTDYKFDHGQAVAIGIRYVCELSLVLGRISMEQRDQYVKMLDDLNLGLNMSEVVSATDPKTLVEMMYKDKKSDGQLNFVLFSDIGGAELVNDIDPEVATNVLKDFFELQNVKDL